MNTNLYNEAVRAVLGDSELLKWFASEYRGENPDRGRLKEIEDRIARQFAEKCELGKPRSEGLITMFMDPETGFKVRTVKLDDADWFVAQDVCDVLGIQNVTQAMGRLDDDEYKTCPISDIGQARLINIVSESGLFALILRSDKPKARAYRKWVTSVVLPSVHRGGYAMAGPIIPTQRRLLKQRLKVRASELRVEIDGVRRQLDAMLAAEDLPGHIPIREWLGATGHGLDHAELCQLSIRLAGQTRRGVITAGEKTVDTNNKARRARVPTYPPEAIAAVYAGFAVLPLKG